MRKKIYHGQDRELYAYVLNKIKSFKGLFTSKDIPFVLSENATSFEYRAQLNNYSAKIYQAIKRGDCNSRFIATIYNGLKVYTNDNNHYSEEDIRSLYKRYVEVDKKLDIGIYKYNGNVFLFEEYFGIISKYIINNYKKDGLVNIHKIKNDCNIASKYLAIILDNLLDNGYIYEKDMFYYRSANIIDTKFDKIKKNDIIIQGEIETKEIPEKWTNILYMAHKFYPRKIITTNSLKKNLEPYFAGEDSQTVVRFLRNNDFYFRCD